MSGLQDFARLVDGDHGLCVVSTLRPDGTIQSSVVNAGVLPHPVTGEQVVGLVSRGDAQRLTHLRARPRATVVIRAGWQWAAAEGPVELAGPDDPLRGVDAERLRLLLREIFVAAGGTHDDFDAYDRVMADERRVAVLVTPARVSPAPRLTRQARWHNALVTQNQSVEQRIADELSVAVRQVRAAVELLDGGATVPFIARYRKEATGTLDDAQLRTLEERLRYLRELDERREAILKEITAQGKLTEELEAQVRAADAKARLEDLYLPYTPKRRTKAQIAREAGLEPLADLLLSDPAHDPQQAAASFVDPDRGVPDANAALEGARAILVERFAEDADLLGELRESMAARGSLTSKVREGQEHKGAKFADY